MINSDFDTVIRNDNNFQNKKNSKIKIFIIIFILLLLLIAGVLGYLYYSKYKSNIPKIKFFEYIDDTNINKITDATLVNAIFEKISNSSYITENSMTIYSQDENFKLPILKFNYKKNNSNANSAELILNKSEDKELIKFSLLHDSENIGIKSDDIVIKYVGSKKANLNNIIQKMNLENTTEENDTSFPPESKIEIPNQIVLEKYKNIINTKLSEDKFTIEENVLLTQNESSMETTLYELRLSKEEVLQILTEIKNQIIIDEQLINCFITGTQLNQNDAKINYLNLICGNKMNYSFEQVVEIVEINFNNLYSQISAIEKFDYLYLDIYVNNDVVVKKSIRIGEYLEINFEEQQKSENENYAKLTLLTSNESNQKDAVLLSINRLDNNVSTIFDLEISTTKSSKINNKLSVNMTLEGNTNSTSLTNKLNVTFSNESKQIKTELKSEIQFGYEEEVEMLDSENCLFLDELDESTLNDIITQISTKIEEVIGLKIQEFLQEDLIVENPNTVQELVDMDGQNDEEKKKEAQDKLIKAISQEMSLAEQEGREYALTNLQTLQVQGSTVSVMVGENMAIIAIDGYTFYIDPNFVLTAE